MHQYRYSNLLVKKLHEKGENFASAQIIAESGWSCEELMEAIHKAEQKKQLATTYDLVSLLIGVNDQYRGYDTTLYPARFEKLLQLAIQYAGGKNENVVILSIPDIYKVAE